MDETYERILLEIDEEKQKHAIRLFQCLAFSSDLLDVEQLAEVIAVDFDAGAIPTLDVDLRPRKAHEAILSACSTLVTTVGGRVVQFSHYSVKEFLTSERLAKSDKWNLSQYYISPGPAHTILAQTCISTLLQLDTRVKYIMSHHIDFPLAGYAARNWFLHARYEGVASQIQHGMECLFDPDRKHFATWIKIHNMDYPWDTKPPTTTDASPLYFATLCGIESLVEHLLTTRRQDPNRSRGEQGTPLRAAVVSGHVGVARVLLEHKSNMDARDKDDRTLLHEAVESGNTDMTQLLISHGADVDARDRWGNSPLHQAARFQNLDVVEVVLEGCVGANIRNSYNSTPLHEAIESGNLDVAQFLIDHGAYINALDRRGNSLLHKAVLSKKFDVVEFIIKLEGYVADVDVRNFFRVTPLHEAVRDGNIDIVQLLISRGANLNARDCNGYSALHLAVRYQRPDVVEILLEDCADVDVRDVYNWTPLHEAVERRNLDIIKLLISHGADLNALAFHPKDLIRHNLKATRSRLDIVKFALKAYLDVRVREIYSSTPLHKAIDRGYHDVVELLSSYGADLRVSYLHEEVRSLIRDSFYFYLVICSIALFCFILFWFRDCLRGGNVYLSCLGYK